MLKEQVFPQTSRKHGNKKIWSHFFDQVDFFYLSRIRKSSLKPLIALRHDPKYFFANFFVTLE